MPCTPCMKVINVPWISVYYKRGKRHYYFTLKQGQMSIGAKLLWPKKGNERKNGFKDKVKDIPQSTFLK